MKKFYVDFEMSCGQEIISIGAVSETGETFYSLVKPQNLKMVTGRIRDITHITKAELKQAPSASEALNKFMKWVGTPDEAYIFTFGSADLAAYTKTLKVNRLNTRNLLRLKNSFIDVSQIISKILRDKNTISLQHAATILNIEFDQTHNALDDAIALKMVMDEIAKKNDEEIIVPILETRIMTEVDKFLNGAIAMYKTKFERVGVKKLKLLTPNEILYILRRSIINDMDLRDELQKFLGYIKSENTNNIVDVLKKALLTRERRVLVVNPTEEITNTLKEQNIDYISCNNISDISDLVMNSKCVLFNNQDNNENPLDLLVLYEAYRQERDIYAFNPVKYKEFIVHIINKEFNNDTFGIDLAKA